MGGEGSGWAGDGGPLSPSQDRALVTVPPTAARAPPLHPWLHCASPGGHGQALLCSVGSGVFRPLPQGGEKAPVPSKCGSWRVTEAGHWSSAPSPETPLKPPCGTPSMCHLVEPRDGRLGERGQRRLFQRPGLGRDGCWCAVGSGWGCDSVGWRPRLERVSEPAVLRGCTALNVGSPSNCCSYKCFQEASEANDAVWVSFFTRKAGFS